jgi:hypothetical protein
MPNVILFLDLDGVAHPADVYVTPEGITLTAEGHHLFENLPLLAGALGALPRLEIVLSTQWVAVAGYRATLARLPPSLRKRVIGATTFGIDPRVWRKQSRFEQIAGYASRNHRERWVALDDDARGWPEDERHRLILTNGAVGITRSDADELVLKLNTAR